MEVPSKYTKVAYLSFEGYRRSVLTGRETVYTPAVSAKKVAETIDKKRVERMSLRVRKGMEGKGIRRWKRAS